MEVLDIPQLSAKVHLFDYYNYYYTLMVPPGTIVLVYEKPLELPSWDPQIK